MNFRPFALMAVLAVIYLSLFPLVSSGYGYPGYGGYYGGGPSFWYFGSTNYYSDRSVRRGSTGGVGGFGGGSGVGK